MKKMLVAVAAVMCAAGALVAADGVWQGPDNGKWDVSANWVDGDIAEGTGSTASFLNGGGTVTNDMVDLTLAGLVFGGQNGFTLSGGLLTLDSLGSVRVNGGSHAVELPLALSGGAALEVAPGQSLEVSGDISGNGDLTVYGGVVKLSGLNTFGGSLVHRTGTVEVASVDALGAGVPSVGEGTFRYTGLLDSIPGYKVDPITQGYATIFDIVDPGAVLTVAGPVVDGHKAPFVKTGEGTLVFGYDGDQTICGYRAANDETSLFEYSADGVLGPTNYPTFGIERGTVIIGRPGRTTDICASSGFIGVRTLASPTLIVDGGVNRFNNGYLTIGRGTGTTASPQQPSMYVRNGSYVDIPGAGFVMANPNGQPDFYCEPYLSVDGGSTFRIGNHCFINEHHIGLSHVDITGGSTFQSDTADPIRGINLPQNGGTVYMTFDTGSTGRSFNVSVRDNGYLAVKGGSVFEFDSTIADFVTSVNRGVAYFDAATLRQRTPAYQSSWFMNLTDLRVGANGMTINVDGPRAVLSPVPLQAPDEAAGTVTKTGAGDLSVPTLPALPVQVQEGTLSLFRPLAQGQALPAAGAVSFASGAGLALAGANSGRDMQLPPRVTLAGSRPYGHLSQWRFAGNAIALPFADGAIQLTTGNAMNNWVHEFKAGAAYLAKRQDVSGAWTVTYDYICNSPFSIVADALAFVVHNDPRGTAALGNAAGSSGYTSWSPDTVEIKSSFAFVFDVYNNQMRFGEDGEFVRSVPLSFPSAPFTLQVAVAYDGIGVVTARVWSKGFLMATVTQEADIPALVGDTKAYIGFSAATGGATAQHMVDNVQFNDRSGMLATPYCQYGGEVVLAGNGRFDATLNASAAQRGFGLGTLTYAPGATVAAHTAYDSEEIPLPSLEDQGAWSLRGHANWKPDGSLALSGPAQSARGWANSLDRFAVTDSWNARFKFSRGISSGAPADFFAFMLHNRGPNNENSTAGNMLSVYVRYFDDWRRDTQLRLYTDGGTYLPTTAYNTDPVDVAKGGPLWVDITYDASAHTLAVELEQDFENNVGGVFKHVFEDIDVAAILGGAASAAQIGFAGDVGGEFTENIISDFSFTPMGSQGERTSPGYLAFSQYNGAGVVVKEGGGELALLGDVDRVPSATAFRLEEGGLRLKRVSDEPFGSVHDRSEWTAMPNTGLWPNGDLLACPAVNDAFGAITSARRVRVAEPFTARFTFLFGEGSSEVPADAFSMFFHNDPRGQLAYSGATANAGFSGVQNSAGFRWYFYQNNGTDLQESFTLGHDGNWSGSLQTYTNDWGRPFITRWTATDIEVKYDPSDKSVVMTMSRDGNVISTVTDYLPDTIAHYTQDDFAYLTFGGGTGGLNGNMLIRDFAFTYDAPVTDKPERLVCGGVEIPADAERTVTLDTSVQDAPFLISTLTVEDGAALRLRSATGGQLRFAATTLGATAGFAPEAGTTLVLDGVVGDSITQQGKGVLKLNGTCDTLNITDGTLVLPAPTLTRVTDLHVATGATLNLDFMGKQIIHSLTVDGITQKGGVYTRSNTSWITGGGVLIVTYPPSATTILIR